MWPDALGSGQPWRDVPPDNAGSPPRPSLEARTVTYVYSENLPSVLAELGGSLLLSTHTTGNVVVLSAPRGQLQVSFHTFERPMGLAVRPGWLLVGTRTQVWSLRDAPDVAVRLEPRGHYDAFFVPRFAHFTGNIQCHELGWVGPGGTEGPSCGASATPTSSPSKAVEPAWSLAPFGFSDPNCNH
jgi:uncharacterized protein (TIGR03032 family)